jgi:diguanylate cyclase (GGDEF)-like protein
VDEKDREGLIAAFELARTDRTPSAPIDLALRAGDPTSPRQLSLRGKTVEYDRRGRPLRTVGVLIDVTDQKAMEEHLMRLVMSDPLTGLANRRAFDQGLRTELRRAAREGQRLSLLMVDIDHFKQFNDTHGHLVGDDVLCLVARAIAGAVYRPADLVSRFGGEEFAIVLPDTGDVPALDVAARVLGAVRGVHLRQAPDAHITVSIGCATTADGAVSTKAVDLLARADAALYRAKGQGRDQCVALPGAA